MTNLPQMALISRQKNLTTKSFAVRSHTALTNTRVYMEPNIAPNMLLRSTTGPPVETIALDRQTTPQIPTITAKAAVLYAPTL